MPQLDVIISSSHNDGDNNGNNGDDNSKDNIFNNSGRNVVYVNKFFYVCVCVCVCVRKNDVILCTQISF